MAVTLGLCLGGAVPSSVALATAGSLKVAPQGTIAGEQVALEGNVPPRRSRPVALQRRRGDTWVTVARGRSSRTGAFRFVTTTRSSTTTYRVLAPRVRIGGRAYAKVQTPWRQVTPVKQQGWLSLPGTAQVGEAVDVSATFVPVRIGRTVQLQRRIGDAWVVEGSSQAQDADGVAGFTITPGSVGAHTYRAVTVADAGAASTPTAPQVIEVRSGPPPPDTAPPASVSNLSATPASNSVSLAWTNPGDADFAGVTIRRAIGSTPPASPTSGSLVADLPASDTTYTDTGLTPSTEYSYALFAHDAVPNHAAAATTSVMTLSATKPFVTGVSPNGRYFVDQRGNPILVKGDSPWAILQNATTTEMDLYVSTRAAQGFNMVLLSLLGNAANGGPGNDGRNVDGDLPFVDADPRQLNDAYWDRVEYFLAKCRDAGITVMAYPIDGWVGTSDYDGLAAGWTATQARAYGAAVAARLKGYENVIWSVGGDYSPASGSANDERQYSVLQGLADGGMKRINTVQFTLNQTSMASDFWDDKTDWNFVYSYGLAYDNVERAYGQSKPGGGRIPALLSEAYYEGYDRVNNLYLRTVVGWALTSGSPGDFYGAWGVWNAPPTESALKTTAAAQISAMRGVFEGLPQWWDLVPDYSSSFITGGRGSKLTDVTDYQGGNTYVTGSRTPDGRLAVLYIPDATGSTVTIDETKMGPDYTATWYDPTSGAPTPATAASSYRKSGANAAGASDWFLVLESSTAR